MKHACRSAIIGLLATAFLVSCTYLPVDSSPATGVTTSETRAAIILTPPSGSAHVTGLIFYPGALVDPHAYVEELSGLATAGIPVVIAKVTGNLAVLSIDAGLGLQGSVAGVTQWVIGGHSLGGVMAAWSVYNHPDAYVGVVFLASYPSTGTSLATWPHPVLSLSASKDGLATPQMISDAASLLPVPQSTVGDISTYAATAGGSLTVFHQIVGGDHAQFGSYGAQDGDLAATITPAEQHVEVVSFITKFFQANGW